jgi:hypothetical protein
MKVTVTVDDPTGASSGETLPVGGEHDDPMVLASSGPIAQATSAGPPSPDLVAAVEAALGDVALSSRTSNGVATDAGAAPV